MAMYAQMVRGQIYDNTSVNHSEKIAAVLCAGEVMAKAHTLALESLYKQCAVGRPAWLIDPKKRDETARLYADMMTGAK